MTALRAGSERSQGLTSVVSRQGKPCRVHGFLFAAQSVSRAVRLGIFQGKDWLLIPCMASTHGLLNGLGFVMLGLLGWLVEWHPN